MDDFYQSRDFDTIGKLFLKKTVEIEELFPENKGYVTYEDDDGTNLFD